MVSSAEKPDWISVEQYLELELDAPTKCEYVDGWIRAMAGAKNRHNAVSMNILEALLPQLKGHPCRPYNSDTKVRIRSGRSIWFYYPDLTVVCDQNSLNDTYQDKPVLVVEVLSRSTRAIDLDEKLNNYLTIPSLEYCLLLEQASPRAILMRRLEAKFIREVYDGLDQTIELAKISCNLPLRDVFQRIDFSPDAVRDEQVPYLMESVAEI